MRSLAGIFIFFLMILGSLTYASSDVASCRDVVVGSIGSRLFHADLEKWKDIELQLKSQTDEQLLVTLSDTAVRGIFFRLQGLGKLYESQDEDFFADVRAQFKKPEDILGQLNLAQTLYQKAVDLKQPKLVKYFAKQLKEKETATVEYFRKSHKFGKVLKYEDWSTGKDEKEEIVESLSDELDKLQKQVDKNKFDESDIEKGLHELRRKLRWINIQITSLVGAVKYSKEEPDTGSTQKLLDKVLKLQPELYQSKYLILPKVTIKKPIIIPFHHLAIISYLVDVIGKYKDSAEAQIYFTEAMEKLRFTSAEKAKVMSVLGNAEVDHRALSVKYQKWLSDSNLLSDFAQALEDLN